MLYQASISQIRHSELTRDKGYLVVTMRTYPRGLKKDWIDQYVSQLAPQPDLFREFKQKEKAIGHAEAFLQSHYEERFQITPLGFAHLERLANKSKEQDVYLLCQCDVGQHCHREQLMLIAQNCFDTKVAKLFHSYSIFQSRIPSRGFLTSQSFW